MDCSNHRVAISWPARAVRFLTTSCLAAGLLLVGGVGFAHAEPLRFVTSALPPLEINRNGEPDGAVLQVLRDLSATMGNPFTVEFLPFPRALAAPQEQPHVGFAGAVRNAEREVLFKWIGPLVYDSIVLVTKKGVRAAPATLSAARDWRIGALNGGNTAAVLKEAGLTNIQTQKDWETGARLLDADRIDAWAVSRLGGPYIYKALGFDPNSLDIGPEICRNDLYIAVSKTVPDDTIAAWQRAVDDMKNRGRIDEITRRFIP
ncbi:substrate-binding periplasmic protein [Azospirillum griseum]|nr:transporter substrate-binding domain-containing protein [Azospirillum griseum]